MSNRFPSLTPSVEELRTLGATGEDTVTSPPSVYPDDMPDEDLEEAATAGVIAVVVLLVVFVLGLWKVVELVYLLVSAIGGLKI